MSAPIAFRPNVRFSVPTGTFRYRETLPAGYLVMSETDGSSQLIPTAEMERYYARGELRRYGTKPVNAHDLERLAPGQVLGPRDRARAWFCAKWDKVPCSRSVAALREFVLTTHRDEAALEGITWFPSPGAMMRALRSRGEKEHRPDATMVSRTGRVPRKSRLGTYVDAAIESCGIWFWVERGRQKQEAHARLARMLHLANVMNARREGWTPVRLPSREATRVAVNALEKTVTLRAKKGRKAAKDRLGGSEPSLEAERILDVVIIDATVSDSWCVWREADQFPMGRPIRYAACDLRSRALLVHHTSYGPPSLHGIMTVLKQIVTPNPNGTWGKPRAIVVDNAWENVSPSWQAACRSAGISIIWAPVRTPEFKAYIERLIGTFKRMVDHKVLGGSVPMPAHVMSRLGFDPAKTACITLEDLEEQQAYAAEEVYAKTKHKGIGEIPKLVWDRQLEQFGRPVVDDLPALLTHFGQAELVTLTRAGVVTKDGLRFADADEVSALLDELAHMQPVNERNKGSARVPVTVVIDPERIKQAQVWNPVSKRMVTLRSVHPEFARHCTSRWEYAMVKGLVDEECAAFSTEAERLARLWKLRKLIESAAPVLRAKAAARHRAMLADQREAPAGDAVTDATAPPSPDGRKPATEIPNTIAARVNEGDGAPPPGVRKGGRAAVEKQKRTVKHKREAQRAQERAQAETGTRAGDGGGTTGPQDQAPWAIDFEKLSWVTSGDGEDDR